MYLHSEWTVLGIKLDKFKQICGRKKRKVSDRERVRERERERERERRERERERDI